MKKVFFILLITLFAGFLSANSLEEIRKSGVIRIGVYSDQPPFQKLQDDGTYDGFEITLAKKIAEGIFKGVQGNVKFVDVKANERIKFLQNNEVDMVLANFTITDERKQFIDFSTPYFSVNIGVLTNKQDMIKSLEDLKGKKILGEKGTTGANFFKNLGYEMVECETAGSCYRKLKAGEAAGYATDNLVALAFAVIDTNFEVNIKNLGKADFLGVGVAKNNKELLSAIDDQLVKLSKENFFKDAFEDYLNVFYKGTAEKKYFLLDDIYSFFG